MVKIVKNKKTGQSYRIMDENIINKTDDNINQKMILYCKIDRLKSLEGIDAVSYVMEKNEFYKKFEVIK